jgi:hypothetical protein
MSLLGKILAVLNVFGVAGFFALALMDYTKRQAWAYAVFRQDLDLKGLPLDKEERDGEGRAVVDLIGESTKKDLYKGQPGPTTQEEEVKRYQAEVQNRIQASTGPKQAAYEAYLLLPFAATNAQRERLLAYRYWLADDAKVKELKDLFLEAERVAKPAPAAADKKSFRERFTEALGARQVPMTEPFVDLLFAALAADANKPVAAAFDQSLETLRADLGTQINQLFTEALNSKQTPEVRKRAIARLLFNLTEPLFVEGGQPAAAGSPLDNPAFQRLFTVVGLRQMIPTIHDQARVVEGIALDLDAERGRERTRFALEHQRLIEQIKEKVAQLEVDAALLKRKQEQVVAHEEELKKRRRDVTQFEEDLATARRDTAEQLKVLRGMSDALLKVRLENREATEQNQKLEKEIRNLEDTVAPARGSRSGK